MPIVTLYEKVRPKDAARGRVGLASGIASRWIAGTAMYGADPHRTAKRTTVPSSNGCPMKWLSPSATKIPMVANRLGTIKPMRTNDQPADF
jgi:hypothetical protein